MNGILQLVVHRKHQHPAANQRIQLAIIITSLSGSLICVESRIHGWGGVRYFVHTVNDYETQCRFKPYEVPVKARDAKTLTKLRCTLFFEALRELHSGGITDIFDVLKQLLDGIRRKLAAEELD